jgi:hypothetical protein
MAVRQLRRKDMTTAIIAACAVACPLLMAGMMWMMRGQGRGRQTDEHK